MTNMDQAIDDAAMPRDGEKGSEGARFDGADVDPGAIPAEASARRRAADDILLEALASGSSYPDAAGLAGVSARTVRRRMRDANFAAEVARRRAERVSAISGRLTELSESALLVLAAAMEAEKVTVQLRAAELVLHLSRRFTQDTDVAARLLALETALMTHPDDDE